MRKILPWTTVEVRLLKSLTAEAGDKRLGPHQIATLPEFQHRSYASIRHAMNAHGFSDPIRSSGQIGSEQLSDERLAELKAFLKNDGKHWPASAVGKQFGVSNTTILRYRRQWQTPKFSHKERLTDPVYRQYWEDNRRDRWVSYGIKAAERLAEKRALMEELKFETKPLGQDIQRRKCAVCGLIWWATTQFFHWFQNKNGGYLSSNCLACPRRAKRKVRRRHRNSPVGSQRARISK